MPRSNADQDSSDTNSNHEVGGHNLRKRTASNSPTKPLSDKNGEVRRRGKRNYKDESDDDQEEVRNEGNCSHACHQTESPNVSRLSNDLSRATLDDSLYPSLDEFKIPESESKPLPANKPNRATKRISTQSSVSSRAPFGYNSCIEDDLSSCFNQKPADLHHHHHHPPQEGINNSGYTETFSWNWFFFVMLICTALVVYISAPYFFSGSPNMLNQDAAVVVNKLDSMMTNMKLMFPSQPNNVWKLIKSGVKRHLVTISKGDLPHYPSVILLVANYSDQTLSCLARKLGKELGEIGVWTNPECSEINLNSWRVSVPGILKLRLDEQITSLYESGTRCIVLTELEGIPAEGAKMLHSFCDTEFAPYKDLVLILTLQMPKKNPLPDVKTLTSDDEWVAIDGQVEHRLKDLWEVELGSVEMAAVLSRIGNAIVPLASESLDKLEIACLN